MELDCLRKKYVKDLTIILNTDTSVNAYVNSEQIKKIIKSYPGACPLMLHYKKTGILTKVKLSASWSVDPKLQLLKDLKTLPEVEDVYINY